MQQTVSALREAFRIGFDSAIARHNGRLAKESSQFPAS
jgi:hypothetical protein